MCISMKRNLKNFSFILWGISLLLCIVFFDPIINFIINTAEFYKGRPISHEFWRHKIILMNLFLVFFLAISGILVYFIKAPFFKKSDEVLFDISSELILLRSKKFLFSIIILYLCLIGLRLFWISQKKSFHVDEPLSISISNHNEYGFWGKNYEFGKYTGKELKEISLWDDDSFLDAFKDIYYLHKDNRDSPHTNFYYTLLRIAFAGIKTGDIEYIFWRGCILNLLLFSISYFFMYALLAKLVKNKLSILFCLLIAFCNPVAVSLSLFMRPYELQQTMMIIFALLFVCSFNKIRNDVVFETKSNFVGAFILALTMLSVYFTLIFIALLGFTILLVTVFKKDYNIFVYYVFMFITSIIFAKLLYFSFGSGLIDYRGQEALSNFQTSNIFLNLRVTFKNVFFIFHKNNFFLILILIFSIFQFGLVFVKNIKTVLISKKWFCF